MKAQVYFGIAIRIVFLFTVAMMATFIPEHLRGFFGDVPCGGDCKYDFTERAWDWGARHYWYAWMMLCLFILTVVNLIIQVKSVVEKHYEL